MSGMLKVLECTQNQHDRSMTCSAKNQHWRSYLVQLFQFAHEALLAHNALRSSCSTNMLCKSGCLTLSKAYISVDTRDVTC